MVVTMVACSYLIWTREENKVLFTARELEKDTEAQLGVGLETNVLRTKSQGREAGRMIASGENDSLVTLVEL